MNVVCVIQAGCRMSLLEIFLHFADAENISRKIITRCINTAKSALNPLLPCLHHGELSARSGEALQKAFADKRITEAAG